jgi:hypothetical protein
MIFNVPSLFNFSIDSFSLEFYELPWYTYHVNQFHWVGHGSSHVKHKKPKSYVYTLTHPMH